MKTTLQILTASVAALLALSAPADAAQVGNTYYGTNALITLNNNPSYTGSYNTGFGANSLYYDQSGDYNTAVGYQSLYSNTASGSTAVGFQALIYNTSGVANAGFGYRALFTNVTGNYNTAVGYNALFASTGSGNTAVGNGALVTSTGDYNVAVGLNSLYNATSAGSNTGVGTNALQSATGGNNIGLGANAGTYLTTGSNNIYIGNLGGTAGGGTVSESGIIRIGHPGTQTATYLIGDVYCAAINITSDRNAKERFTPVNAREVLDKVARLPITEWQYKIQSKAESEIRHIGPMAQDFHEAFSVGPDGKHISTVDADGVALAAIQGLNDKVEAQANEKDARIKNLEKSVEELKSLVEQLTRQSSQSKSK
jgi:hypothetical protein